MLASTYGLGILSFLAGAHWATFLHKESGAPFNLLVSSNLVFLVVWFAFVLARLEWVLAIQLLAFFVLLFVDYRLLHAGLISQRYFSVRVIATALAVISLAVILATA